MDVRGCWGKGNEVKLFLRVEVVRFIVNYVYCDEKGEEW